MSEKAKSLSKMEKEDPKDTAMNAVKHVLMVEFLSLTH